MWHETLNLNAEQRNNGDNMYGDLTSHSIKIGERKIGPGQSTYIIAELSANHNQDFHQAVKLVHAAAEAGADAVKLQTYTADTLTIDCDRDYFQIGQGTIWAGRNLYDLYGEAYTPWEWQPRIKALAEELGMQCFSSPFDATAVDFLEEMDVPAYKVASFEIVDTPLLEKIGATGKPAIVSTGMASLAEVSDAVDTLRRAGTPEIALLKCVSAYPAPPEAMNLRTIPHLAEAFSVTAGLSDHTLGIAVPVASVALGATIIEKHFTLSRDVPGPDSQFSLEPYEFRDMVKAVRVAESVLGKVQYGVGESEQQSRAFRRSLFVVQDVKKGEELNQENVRSIRPGHGMAPRYLPDVIGRVAGTDIPRGTPLDWRDVA
ncbi:MAG: pseudaminic acid synthase [Fuerstiella sp.]|nr:pseudaminic acid synthase [Fuerstiella sp.]